MLGEGGGNILGCFTDSILGTGRTDFLLKSYEVEYWQCSKSSPQKKKSSEHSSPPFPPHLPTVPTVLPVEHQSAFATLLCYTILHVSHNQAKSRRNWSYNANTANNRPVRGNLWSCPIKLLWKWQKLDFYLKHLTWGEHQKNKMLKCPTLSFYF